MRSAVQVSELLLQEGQVVAGGHGRGKQPHQLDSPVDVILGSEGSLFIAEYHNNRVTRWGPLPQEKDLLLCVHTPCL